MMGLPHRPRSRHGAGLPAVTPEQIVDAAVRLTAEAGLEAWTLRQLAAEIEASPAVVYHHIGDREAVVGLVIERVMTEVDVPCAALPWRKWFALMLDNHRVVLRNYPGTAYRLAMHGPPVATAAKTIDLGIRLLQEAGFGLESVLAYNVLMTTAYQYIAMEDDPAKISGVGMRDRNMSHYLTFRERADLPGMAAVGHLVAQLVSGPDKLAEFHEDIFGYAVERCLDGLERRLADLAR
jgi:AcrR family transcriptional regulator